MKLDDFIRLFSPSGLINGFVTGNLLPYIDTSASSWRSKQLGGVDLGLGSGALAQFQRAARIRDGFFPPGNPQPGLRFFLTPAALDPGTREVVLEVDGQSISYTHGVRMPATIQWPPSGGLGQVRLAFLDGSGTNTAALNAHGPWAWFRLLDQGVVEQRGPGALHVTFSAGGHSVSYDVQAASVLTPLTLNDLAEFRCPRL